MNHHSQSHHFDHLFPNLKKSAFAALHTSLESLDSNHHVDWAHRRQNTLRAAPTLNSHIKQMEEACCLLNWAKHDFQQQKHLKGVLGCP